MQVCLLHLDDALRTQPPFWQAGGGHMMEVDAQAAGKEVRLWGRETALQRLQILLKETFAKRPADGPRLCFMGSGDFHHVTALLLPLALEAADEPVTVIHFDNHPDWVRFEGGMHCGSWVNRAMQHRCVAKVVTVGVCSGDLRNPEWKGANLVALKEGRLELFPYRHTPSRARKEYGEGTSYRQEGGYLHWNTIEDQGEATFLDLLLSRIDTEAVYLTVDKDVLSREDAETNWDQGVMRLPFLQRCISAIGKAHRILSADINGDYSVPSYGGSAWTRCRKHAEIFMDQPRHKRDVEAAATLNSATNRSLLGTFAEVMA